MFGLVAYEALAFGKPVIVAKKAALIECCYNYNSCICVKDNEELANKILKLFSTGLDISSLKFPPSWNDATNQYFELYKKLIEA
jgi:glycosyltransferase involved in cell wall biosynthesis